jgi:hypothetical protein
VADHNEHADTLHRYNLLPNLFFLFLSSSPEIRRDACWLVSNLCCERNSATRVIREKMLIAKLVDLFADETHLETQR